MTTEVEAESNGHVEGLSPVSNDAANQISFSEPYVVTVKIKGISAILFHRWSCEAVEEKARAAKGSAAKKTDDTESYVWRTHDGLIGLPGEYVRQSLVNPQNGAAKYRQDPRSPRKSALDLYKAGVIALTDVAPMYINGKTTTQWDFLDRRRVKVQMSAITRERPAFHPGWEATVQLMVNTPEYINPMQLHACLSDAGRLVGVGDFRPTYGRFQIVEYNVGLE